MKALMNIFLFLSVTSMANEWAQVCSIPLPVTKSSGLNRLLLGTKHVYLRIGKDTFGTPFTNNHTYNGGAAYLYDGDPLYKKGPKGEKCYPIKSVKAETQQKLAKRLKCIAKKMAYHPQKKLTNEWYAVFDYNFLTNNCGSMVNYLLQCAHAKPTKRFNFGVGDEVQSYKSALIRTAERANYNDVLTDYGDICRKALDECED